MAHSIFSQEDIKAFKHAFWTIVIVLFIIVVILSIVFLYYITKNLTISVMR
jgi:hypothetical protein